MNNSKKVYAVSQYTDDENCVIHGIFEKYESAVQYATQLSEEMHLELDEEFFETYGYGVLKVLKEWWNLDGDSIRVEEYPLN
jgi:hypothetical protein